MTNKFWDMWLAPIGIGLRWGIGFAVLAITIKFPNVDAELAISPFAMLMISAAAFYLIIPLLRKIFSTLFDVRLSAFFSFVAITGVALMVLPSLGMGQSLQFTIGNIAFEIAQWYFLVFAIDYFRTSSIRVRALQLIVSTAVCGFVFLTLVNIPQYALLPALFVLEIVMAVILSVTAGRMTVFPRKAQEAFIVTPQWSSFLYGMLVGCIIGMNTFKQSSTFPLLNVFIIIPCVVVFIGAYLVAKRMPDSNPRLVGYGTAAILIVCLTFVFASESSLSATVQGAFVASWLLSYNVNALGVRPSKKSSRLDPIYLIFFGPLIGWIPFRIINDYLLFDKPEIAIAITLFSAYASIVMAIMLIAQATMRRLKGAQDRALAETTQQPIKLEQQVKPEPTLKERSEVIAEKYGLSSREKEVFSLLAAGRGRKYISETLFIAEGTVKTHVSSIYSKLGIHTREELINLINETEETKSISEDMKAAL